MITTTIPIQVERLTKKVLELEKHVLQLAKNQNETVRLLNTTLDMIVKLQEKVNNNG